jgi:hypothetical protein
VPHQLEESLLFRCAIPGLAAVTLLATKPHVEPCLYVLQGDHTSLHFERPRETAEDLARLKSLVRPGEDALVVPLRNRIHLELGTRSRAFPSGYLWWNLDSGHPLSLVRWSELDAVIVVPPLSSYWKELWEFGHFGEYADKLDRYGFEEVERLRTMTLYRPRRRSSEGPR